MGDRFRDLLTQRIPIVFDGAMGTVLFERGIYINRCYDQLNLDNPGLVRDIHREYVEAGAMVVETNTFGANRFKLASFDLADRTREINSRGALLAREAAGDAVLVAGSIGPLGVRVEPWGAVTIEQAGEAFTEQIQALADAGVDLIVLETFSDLAEIGLALRAIAEFNEKTGENMPILASMAVDEEGNSLYGTEPEVFGPKLQEWGADVIGINCSVGPRPMLDALGRLQPVVDVPLSVMPNAGLPTVVEGRMIYLCSPDYMAKFARRFTQVGARVIGGCCGTMPAHIRAIAVALRQVSGERRSLAARASASNDKGPAPQPAVPLIDRSKLAAKLIRGEFVSSVELTPPQGWSLARIMKSAQTAKDAGFDAINIPDGPRASARMGPMAMAHVLEHDLGMETIMHYACRDRNLVGMQSDLLGAYALGMRNILVITGDPPIMGDYPQATAVFDVDSIGLTHMVTRLNQGLDLGNRSIGEPTGFLVLVGLNPTAINPEKEVARFRLKIQAGAHGAITQPVFDAAQLLDFLAQFEDQDKIPVLAGIWPLQSLRNAEFLANEVPGVSVPGVLLDRMAAARKRNAERAEGEKIAIEIFDKVKDRVDGIQLAAPFGRIKSAVRVLEAARALVGR